MCFYKKALSKENTQQLSKEHRLDYMRAILLQNKDDKVLMPEDVIRASRGLPAIIAKRIKAYDIPLEVTISGYLTIEILADGNTGKAIAILIDCLTTGAERINADVLTRIYPFGFYNDDVFTDYIDNYLKLRKVKWSKIY